MNKNLILHALLSGFIRDYKDGYKNTDEFIDGISDYANQIEELFKVEEKSQWINVKDELPEDDLKVLVYLPNAVIIGFIKDGKWFMWNDFPSDKWLPEEERKSVCKPVWSSVVEWMPLPKSSIEISTNKRLGKN